MLSDSSRLDIICPACGNEIKYQNDEIEILCDECHESLLVQELTDAETGECWYNIEQL